MFFKNNIISIRISVFTSVHGHRTCGSRFTISTQIEKYFKINLIYIIRQLLKGCPDIRNLPLLCNCTTAVTWVFYRSIHRKSNCVCWVFIINHKKKSLHVLLLDLTIFLSQSKPSRILFKLLEGFRSGNLVISLWSVTSEFFNFVWPKITVV